MEALGWKVQPRVNIGTQKNTWGPEDNINYVLLFLGLFGLPKGIFWSELSDGGSLMEFRVEIVPS
jgi:hypothetical protein